MVFQSVDLLVKSVPFILFMWFLFVVLYLLNYGYGNSSGWNSQVCDGGCLTKTLPGHAHKFWSNGVHFLWLKIFYSLSSIRRNLSNLTCFHINKPSPKHCSMLERHLLGRILQIWTQYKWMKLCCPLRTVFFKFI